MKVIVGLGNPGSRYLGTRHNIGFDVLCDISRRWGAERPRQRFEAEIAEVRISSSRVMLVWPQTYMNLSGRAVGQIVQFHKISVSDVLVVCDDLNLKLGRLRLRGSGSAGGQKGLQSIIQVLGTEAVPRLRFGIDRPATGEDSAQYVLAKFRKEELEVVDATVRQAVDGIEQWVSQGLGAAMNLVNAPADDSTGREPPSNGIKNQ